MNLIKRLFSSDDAEPVKLLCPNCERPLDEKHTTAACKAGHSRRFFVQMLAGCAVVGALESTASRAAAVVLATPEHVRQEKVRVTEIWSKTKAGWQGVWYVNGDYITHSTSIHGSCPIAVESIKKAWNGVGVFGSAYEAKSFYWNRNAKMNRTESGLLMVESRIHERDVTYQPPMTRGDWLDLRL